MQQIEHPDIYWMEKTGYPLEDKIEDDDYENYLCEKADNERKEEE